MSTYSRSVRVRARFERVWEFHSGLEGLVALTPDWFNLEVEVVRDPSGGSDPDVLEPGVEVQASVRPCNVGPRQQWTSRITAREHTEGAGYFRDEMVEGPFSGWEHTHSFFADGSETIVRDRVVYELPGGPLGKRASPLAVIGLEPTFRYRHRETKRLLEGGRG